MESDDGITRRAFVESAAGAALGVAISAHAETGPSGEAQLTSTQSSDFQRPNVLVIHTDQQRFDCLGCMGNPDIRTPNIDTLARDGVRFENSFCPYPVCTPSRYSLLTGQYVNEHCGWTNRCTLKPGTETFPSLMRKAGYATAAVGKMHFTPTYLDVGFERMILSEQDGDGRWDDDYHRELRDAGLVDINDLEDQRSEYRKNAPPEYWENFGALPSNLPLEFHSTEWIARKALGNIEEWGPAANVLMVGFIKPHHPFDPPSEWANAYDPEALTILPGWTSDCAAHDLAKNKGYFPNVKLTETNLRRGMAYYYATIEHIDVQVGKLVDALKRKGIYDNTVIVFTSDHGELLGFHHLLLKGGYMYDPLVRVPLIIKYLGAAQAGTVDDRMLSNIDVAPTLLARAGIAPAATMTGSDLAMREAGRDIVFAESDRGDQAMARNRRYKLIRSDKSGEDFLFDLENDPYELQDRSDDPDLRDVKKDLIAAIAQWRGANPLKEIYVDENAPVIQQPNVPPRDGSHRDAIIEYFAQRMAALRKTESGK